MVPRPGYLAKLAGFKDTHLIKVITGIRRCGKSTLLELFRDQLREQGVPPKRIISVNFEDVDAEPLRNYKKLHDHISALLVPGKMNYVFLDEIQNVPEYQKAADSLFIKKNVDLYLTGSNAHLLAGELATLLAGRFVEINMLPLSFREYVSAFADTGDLSRKYARYLTESSFPYTLELGGDTARINDYLGGVYNTIILKDVITRKRIADPLMLDSVIRFMFFNIGNLCSSTNIANTLKSQSRPVSVHTIENYLSGLSDCFLLYRAGRYDVKGKQFLRSGDKYYAVDLGLRYYLLGSKNANLGSILENMIYLELRRRDLRVYVGKVGDREIDFITEEPGGETGYYQAALTVRDGAVLERELAPLKAVKNHNPKYLLTLDEDPPVSHDGIRQINALDWLLGKG